MNYVSPTVLKQRIEAENRKDEETIIGQVLVLAVALAWIVVGIWLFR